MAAVRGEGSRLWDSTGKCYLDFCAGIATCVLGHCHPAVTQALQKQAATLVQHAVHPDALTIFGATFDESLDDEIRVTVIATGFAETQPDRPQESAAAQASQPDKLKLDPLPADGEKADDDMDKSFNDILKIFQKDNF